MSSVPNSVRFALVNFQSPDAAKAAVDALHLNLGSPFGSPAVIFQGGPPEVNQLYSSK